MNVKSLTTLFLFIHIWIISSHANPVFRKPVKEVTEKVAAWQLAHLPDIDWWTWPSPHQYGQYLLDWEYGAFYSGLMDWHRVSPQNQYLDAMMDIGKKYEWTVRPRLWDANILCIGHLYVDLYKMKKNPDMIKDVGFALNAYLDRDPRTPDITFAGNKYWWSWWSWCDALYMAPPTFAKYAEATREIRYLDKMHELYKITYDYLYDKDERLFFRDDRFFNQRSPSGKKIFWARGNGWVIAGLVKILQSMPKDYPHRPFYENLFKEMCSRMKEIQQPEGHWSSSLLDATHYGGVETSGTGFICYALAYGINNGYLNGEEYLPSVEKAWSVLVKSVHPDGKLGYVQRVGDAPDAVSYDHTASYGVGAFLSAASEVYRLFSE